jgi:hypothetical protein
MIPGGHHVDAEIEEFLGEWRRNAEAGSSVFAIGNDQVDGKLLHDSRKAFFDDGSPGAAEDVSDEKNVQE